MMRNLLMSAAVALACVSAAFAQKAAEKEKDAAPLVAAPVAPGALKQAVIVYAVPRAPAQQAKPEGAAAEVKGVAKKKAQPQPEGAAVEVMAEDVVVIGRAVPAGAVVALPLVPAQKVVAQPKAKEEVKKNEAVNAKAAPKAKAEAKKEAAKAAMPALRVERAVQIAPAQAIDMQFFNGQVVRRANQPPDPLALALSALSRANPNAVDPQTSQFMLQYRSLLMAEYASLVAACQPEKDQRRAIARAGEAALVRYCEALSGQNRNQLMRNGKFPQTRDYFADALLQAACANLTPRQVARYVAEVESRKAYRTDAVFKGAVAVLDYRLYLTPEQREKIEAKLRAEWKDPPEPEALQYYFNQPNSYVPNFPANLVEPELDDDQKLVYKSIQKVSFGHGFAMNERGDLPLEDAELPPYAVRAAEPRQPQNGAIGLGGAIFRRVQQGLRGD